MYICIIEYNARKINSNLESIIAGEKREAGEKKGTRSKIESSAKLELCQMEKIFYSSL